MNSTENISKVERTPVTRNTGENTDLTKRTLATAAIASNRLDECAICYESLWNKKVIKEHGQPIVPHPDGGEKHPMHLRCFAAACKALGNTCPICRIPIETANLEDLDLGETKEEEEDQPALLKPLADLRPTAPPAPGEALPTKTRVVLTPSAPPGSLKPQTDLSVPLKPRVVVASSAPPLPRAALRPSAPRTAWWRAWLCWDCTDTRVRDVYPVGSFGPQFYKGYFGGNPLPVVPIQWAFLERANWQNPTNPKENWEDPIDREEDKHIVRKITDTFQLVFLPEFIRIVFDANSSLSSLTLNENGRLIEGPIAIGEDREIDVPVTLNNMAMLAEKCLRRGTPSGFHEQSMPNVLAQHGDTRIKSHWFYPRKETVWYGGSYAQQQVNAARAGLEITPLIDTAIYYLLRKISLGNSDDIRDAARTSTPTLDDSVPPRALPSILSCPGARPVLTYSSRDDYTSVAVGVPDGSSQAIGNWSKK